MSRVGWRHAMARGVLASAVSVLFLGLPGCDGEALQVDCTDPNFTCAEGFVCDAGSGACLCDPLEEDACGEHALCDRQTGECVCTTDDCCPDDHRFDPDQLACVCAGPDCCPDDHRFDEAEERCVCDAELCCPEGFAQDLEAGRCLCESDDACGLGFTCDEETGDCRCANDEACGAGEFCNDIGFCQAEAACVSSLDCPEGRICDPAEGVCVSEDCVLDADCPFSSICEEGACVAGCRTNDDCWLAEACLDDGLCHGDTCNREAQCGIGEWCDDGGCVAAEGSYCEPCPDGAGDCPDEGDACGSLLGQGSDEPACMPECDPDDDPSCPSGYGCYGSISQCNPILGPLACPGDYVCREFEFHDGSSQYFCSDPNTGQPARVSFNCVNVHQTCDVHPEPGQSTRPGEGERCTTLCQDGLVCAAVGDGHRCYPPCDGGCPSGTTCVELEWSAGEVCVAE